MLQLMLVVVLVLVLLSFFGGYSGYVPPISDMAAAVWASLS